MNGEFCGKVINLTLRKTEEFSSDEVMSMFVQEVVNQECRWIRSAGESGVQVNQEYRWIRSTGESGVHVLVIELFNSVVLYQVLYCNKYGYNQFQQGSVISQRVYC